MSILYLQTLYASLQQMLEYEGEDLEDVFMQPFKIGYKDVFGCDLTHELKEKGADTHVNHSNRQVSVLNNVKQHIYTPGTCYLCMEASCDNPIVDTWCLFDLMFTVGVR